MLEAGVQANILHLFFTEKLSHRQIAHNLMVDRKTVKRVVDRRQVVTKTQQNKKRSSILEPYHTRIEKLLTEAPKRSCVNILQNLRDTGYQGGVSILREHIQKIRPKEAPKEAFLKLDFAPGEASQVDWGELGDVFGNGTKVRVFVMVLCWSRLLYLEFTFKETLPTLLRCYERALKFFGGRCKEYWHDNMSTVLNERIGNLSRFTSGFYTYTGFHGFKPVLCAKGKGNEKGRVEDGVKLIKQQFWPGRTFENLDDINQQAFIWRDKYANRREHATTGKIPELMFEEEKASLIPLRPEPYDTDDLVSCAVSKFYRVCFETNTYSLPCTMVGKTVTLRADDKNIRIYYGAKQIAKHTREYRKNKDYELPEHREHLKQIKKEASRTWQIETLRSFGPYMCHYLEIIQAGTRSLRSEIKELLCLGTVYGQAILEKTIGEMLKKGIVGTDCLERMLRMMEVEHKAPQPMEFKNERLHFIPPAPNLEEYNAYLLDSKNEPEKKETP